VPRLCVPVSGGFCGTYKLGFTYSFVEKWRKARCFLSENYFFSTAS
jgi:hypothetical protein